MKNKIKEVCIVGQDHKGRGIARIDGKIAFVNNALPNEICDIVIEKETTKFLEANVVRKVQDQSILPNCLYYEFCGGCDLLHQRYEDQLLFKEKKVREVLRKFAGIDISLNPTIFDEPFFYRNKIILHNLGLYQKRTKNSIVIKECQLVDKKINEVIKRLQVYSQNSNNIIEEVMIRISNQGEVLISASGKIQKKKFQKYFEDIDVLLVNNICLTKKDFIVDQINRLYFQVSSASFYQINRYVTPKLYNLVLEIYKKKKLKTVLDLYCGTGTIALSVAPFAEKVIGIEIVKEAVENANNNKKLNHIKNVEFICGKVENYIDQFHNIDGIIVDPPRSGLDCKTIDTILKILPQIVTYVSCDVVTLARDLKKLKEQYEIKEITPVDMFPNTCHVECVCVLNRR